MFKCVITGENSFPGEKCHKIVLKTRERVYTRKEWIDDVLQTIEVGRGFEIVKEVNATQKGVNKFLDQYKDHPIMKFNQGLHWAPPATAPVVTVNAESNG